MFPNLSLAPQWFGRCGPLNHYEAVGTGGVVGKGLLAVKQPLLGSPVEKSREEEEVSKSRKVRLLGVPQRDIIYYTHTQVVKRWEKHRCEGESTDSKAETFYNKMQGEICQPEGGRRFMTRRCAILDMHASTG